MQPKVQQKLTFATLSLQHVQYLPTTNCSSKKKLTNVSSFKKWKWSYLTVDWKNFYSKNFIMVNLHSWLRTRQRQHRLCRTLSNFIKKEINEWRLESLVLKRTNMHVATSTPCTILNSSNKLKDSSRVNSEKVAGKKHSLFKKKCPAVLKFMLILFEHWLISFGLIVLNECALN